MAEVTQKQSMPLTALNGNRLGKQIRKKRKELGMTQEDLVIWVKLKGQDISQPYLSQIERGRIKPRSVSAGKLITLMNVLGIDTLG